MADAKIIVFEGADAAGKKTQAGLLTARLEKDGHRVAAFSFPQYQENKIGGLLRECIDGKRGDFFAMDPLVSATLFAADRVETMARLRSALTEADYVILDRYTTSNIVHQGAKELDAVKREAVMRWVYELEHSALALPEPSAIFALAIPAVTRMELIKKRSRESGIPLDQTDANFEHQQHVDQVLTELKTLYPQSLLIAGEHDAKLRSIEAIHDEVYAALLKLV